MKNFKLTIKALSLLIISAFFINDKSLSQIIPDSTIPSKSEVIQQGNSSEIKGGTINRTNLFHSFQEFSLSTGSTAYFNNPEFIKVILTRITGTNISNINGLIKNNGATLFFINPNGIIFGPNTKLEIGGSFIASSSRKIRFKDGSSFGTTEFSTRFSDLYPNSLEFALSPKPISLIGKGNTLIFADQSNPIASPIIESTSEPANFSTNAGNTLALIGGPISLQGGIISAPSGSIEIGSIGSSGLVNIIQSNGTLKFDYSNINKFENIQVTDKSLIEAGGSFNGNIHIQGNDLSLTKSSLILNSNFGNQKLEDIKIDATGSVMINSLTPEDAYQQIISQGQTKGVTFGGFFSQNFANGIGSKILIKADSLTLKNFSSIDSFNYGTGIGGDIEVHVVNDLNIYGKPPIESSFLPSAILSFTTSGNAGNINLSGRNFSIFDGGLSLSQTVGLGNSGNTTYSFLDNVTVQGAFPVGGKQESFIPSAIGTTTAIAGNSGDVSINSKNLLVLNGGTVSSTSNGVGNAGKINISLSNLLEISGAPLGSNSILNRSRIISSVESVEKNNPFIAQTFDLQNNLAGKSGSIEISASKLLVDGGIINVSNSGIRTGGDIAINTRDTKLNNALISATSINSSGGSISFDSSNLISLLAKSLISTTSNGVGGDIRVDVPLFNADSSSSISANSTNSFGGNISINAPARVLSPRFSITATSALGQSFNGTILFTAATSDSTRYIKSTSDKIDSPQQIKPCDPRNPSDRVNNFGGGGSPQNLADPADISLNWQQKPIQTSLVSADHNTREKIYWIEPGGVVRNSDGSLRFVVKASDAGTAMTSNNCTQQNVSTTFPKGN